MEVAIVSVVNFLLGLVHLSPELLAGVFGILLAISEGLALIPGLKSNSVLQLIMNVLKKLMGK